ncbi:MAG TPA: hypothetical protein VN649_21870 [Ramlibacter sp.]|nr:hypothetical protein [Ramlibacter sp.]
MCYLIRQTQSETERGGSVPSPGLDRLRSRWIGAAAALLVGGVAVAALVGGPATPPAQTKDSASAAPVVSRTAAVPTAAGVEQVSLPADDGVPTSSSDVVKAGLGHCHHDM